ncbi:MAG TPA: hypothetical protein VGK85_09910, partial [Myxococcaceae bacterium]
DLSEEAFDKLRERWPMGHLGRLLGLDRQELLRLPRAESVLLPLDADPPAVLDPLFAGHAADPRH